MKILIEEYPYNAKDVAAYIKGLDALENVEGKVSINYVGYFYNAAVEDCIFILPKVLLNENNIVLNKFKPEELIDIDKIDCIDEQRRFIYEFAVWIYRTIAVFKNDKNNKDSSIIYHRTLPQNGGNKRHIANTFLEVLLELLRFNKENQNFFMFILKNLHSGMNKINWTRTIAHSSAFVTKGVPVYTDPINKKRQINFDEELIVIFFSILNYISGKYGFPVKIALGFELLKGKVFENYLKGFGKVRLFQIKYKYFSDKALLLWELCYAFFDKAHTISIKSEQKEYLLAKNFNIVFEAIIDELIGDRKHLPKDLLEQKDGKRVDHMYQYKGLIENEDEQQMYYIGDSKYYKQSTPIGEESVYKQYTYARNVIQWNMDLFNNQLNVDKEYKKKHHDLRDEVTEGYNIIPNFFISAMLDENLSYESKLEYKNDYKSFQYKNRLFDRDTLLIAHYNVNFLYVVSLYARNNESQKKQWKAVIYEEFRTKIQKMLKDKFNFYAMRSKQADQVGLDYLKTHFQDVLGKVYTPFKDTKIYSLALEKDDQENNDQLISELGTVFDIKECELGNDPADLFPARTVKIPYFAGKQNDIFLVGYVKNKAHWDWIVQNEKYNIRLADINGRPGGITPTKKHALVSHIILVYNKEVRVYDLLDSDAVPATYKEDEMVGYPEPHGKYLIYEIDTEKDSDLQFEEAIKEKFVHLIERNKVPQVGTLEELLQQP